MKARTLWTGFLTTFLTASWIGMGMGLVQAESGDSKAGKASYDKQCASCHGPDGVAKEAIAKMFKVEMKPLASKEVQAKTDADLQKAMMEGTGKMKPVKGLTDKDATNIIAFLRTLATSK